MAIQALGLAIMHLRRICAQIIRIIRISSTSTIDVVEIFTQKNMKGAIHHKNQKKFNHLSSVMLLIISVHYQDSKMHVFILNKIDLLF